MKAILLVLLLTTSSAFATDKDTILECGSSTEAGEIVSISACITREGGPLKSCSDDEEPYITITKEYWVDIAESTSPVVESVKIPAGYFDLQWKEESSFSLKMDNVQLGKVTLIHGILGEEIDTSEFDVNVKAFKYSSKLFICSFVYPL